MSTMNPVVHFEMPYEDQNRMAEFYTNAFGWQAQILGPEMGNYVTVSTAETDPTTHMPKQPGAINGGFYKKSQDNSSTSIVIGVSDIRDAMKKVEAAGGKILPNHVGSMEPDEIPGVGLYMSFIDSEGNRVSMLQPMGM